MLDFWPEELRKSALKARRIGRTWRFSSTPFPPSFAQRCGPILEQLQHSEPKLQEKPPSFWLETRKGTSASQTRWAAPEEG